MDNSPMTATIQRRMAKEPHVLLFQNTDKTVSTFGYNVSQKDCLEWVLSAVDGCVRGVFDGQPEECAVIGYHWDTLCEVIKECLENEN